MKIKAEKITSGKSFIILITAAVLMTVAGAVMLILALKYYISAKNTTGETQETQTVYNSAFGETVPLEKEKVEEIVNYEQPVSFPPTKLLDVPYINQRAKYPTGCESISAVMALNFAGYSITPEDFIDNYLPKSDAPYVGSDGKCYGYNPSKVFLGDPYKWSGWGCYYPVIRRCLSAITDRDRHTVVTLHNKSLKELCSYIDAGVPVIVWATQGMNKPKKSQTWMLVDDGVDFTWVSPNHCLLLVGYDDSGFYFNDPLTHKDCRYPADIAEKRYKSMGRQALAIAENPYADEAQTDTQEKTADEEREKPASDDTQAVNDEDTEENGQDEGDTDG